VGRTGFELCHAGTVGARGAGAARAAAADVLPLLRADGGEGLVEATLQPIAQHVPARAARQLADVHLPVWVDEQRAEAGTATIFAVVGRMVATAGAAVIGEHRGFSVLCGVQGCDLRRSEPLRQRLASAIDARGEDGVVAKVE